MKKEKPQVWFTSDLHFSHKNILKFTPKRLQELGLSLEDPEALKKHNDILIMRWNMTVGKHDTVYILGDVSFDTADNTKKILEKLHGKKHLILGNHDNSCRGLDNYFESISQIKEVWFKTHMFPFLDENMHCILCHFPLLAWNRRNHGSIMVHGHLHGEGDKINADSEELRIDIGIDSQLGDCNLVSLSQLYEYVKTNITKGKTFQEHIDYVMDKNQFRA